MGELLDYSKDLGRLAELAAQPQSIDDVLSSALASLRRIIHYDLAAIYELSDDQRTLQLRAAHGPLADERIAGHRLELARFATIRRALETRRPIPLEAHHHRSDEGDPYDGVLDLPAGHSCMVVPLFAGRRDIGLITLDRTTCATYEPEVVELASVYGQIVSLALLFAEQAELLDRYRRQVSEHNRLLVAERGGELAGRRIEQSRSPAMRELSRLARQVAASDMPVLLSGETGSGKEVLAAAIHGWSARAQRPLVTLNCAAIPESLVESELFGHVAGAFSGATRDRPGRFVTANGGTLLLDEIGDTPLSLQSKLLRVLQEGSFEPVGSDRTVRVDVRVIAATHRDLAAAVAAGRFREDLYYRLAVFPLRVPPLRERREDIAPIAQSLLDEATRRGGGRGPWTLTAAALAALEAQPWPGNVRQLINVIERATILQPRGEIDVAHLALEGGGPRALLSAGVEASAPALPSYRENEARYLRDLLSRSGGKIYGEGGAAELSGLKPTTLQSKLKKLGLK
ncbi:MAG: sigma 54-interacting transcriptional regulator [Myxococcales bacterium]|nr:sigma 54-interacting transcriptional regulator [Myxococcales bacterium]